MQGVWVLFCVNHYLLHLDTISVTGEKLGDRLEVEWIMWTGVSLHLQMSFEPQGD